MRKHRFLLGALILFATVAFLWGVIPKSVAAKKITQYTLEK